MDKQQLQKRQDTKIQIPAVWQSTIREISRRLALPLPVVTRNVLSDGVKTALFSCGIHSNNDISQFLYELDAGQRPRWSLFTSPTLVEDDTLVALAEARQIKQKNDFELAQIRENIAMHASAMMQRVERIFDVLRESRVVLHHPTHTGQTKQGYRYTIGLWKYLYNSNTAQVTFLLGTEHTDVLHIKAEPSRSINRQPDYAAWDYTYFYTCTQPRTPAVAPLRQIAEHDQASLVKYITTTITNYEADAHPCLPDPDQSIRRSKPAAKPRSLPGERRHMTPDEFVDLLRTELPAAAAATPVQPYPYLADEQTFQPVFDLIEAVRVSGLFPTCEFMTTEMYKACNRQAARVPTAWVTFVIPYDRVEINIRLMPADQRFAMYAVSPTFRNYAPLATLKEVTNWLHGILISLARLTT